MSNYHWTEIFFLKLKQMILYYYQASQNCLATNDVPRRHGSKTDFVSFLYLRL